MDVEADKVPVFAGVAGIARQNRSGGLTSNQEHFGRGVEVAPEVPIDLIAILFDPQTSGGLLIAVDAAHEADVAERLVRAGDGAWRIGRVSSAAGDARVRVV